MKRNETYLKVYLFFVLTLGLVLNSTTTFGKTINVPDDYETIQAAIKAAEDGDEIVVSKQLVSGKSTRFNFNKVQKGDYKVNRINEVKIPTNWNS